MRPKIGVALGSGAARGWSHIGVLDALQEAGLEPDIVCGTSMGALVGAAHVTGRLSVLKDWACALTRRGIVSLLDVRLTGGGLIDGDKISALLGELGIAAPIEQVAKPFAAVATSLVTGREIWLRTGPIVEAVRASIGIPGIIRPVKHVDDWLLDGGLVNPVPVSVCRALGADIIIAVNLNSDLLGRRFQAADEPHNIAKSGPVSQELLNRLLEQVPQACVITSRRSRPHCSPHSRPRHQDTLTSWPILSTSWRTKSPALDLPVSHPTSCWRRAWVNSPRLNLIARQKRSQKVMRAFNRLCRICDVISKVSPLVRD